MFETDDEKKSRQQKQIIIIASIGVIVMIFLGTYGLIQELKPLPQTSVCEAAGFVGGEELRAGVYRCYNDCSSNVLKECRVSRVIG